MPLDDLDELAVALQAEAESESRTIVGAVVDLNGLGYDGVEAIERIRRARLPVIAVAQHDDELTRKRALAAGAMRVFSYDKFHRDGIRLVGRWLSDESTEADPAPA